MIDAFENELKKESYVHDVSFHYDWSFLELYREKKNNVILLFIESWISTYSDKSTLTLYNYFEKKHILYEKIKHKRSFQQFTYLKNPKKHWLISSMENVIKKCSMPFKK